MLGAGSLWLAPVADAQSTDPRDEAIRALQQQLAKQQALIEAQQRQIDRLIDRVEARDVKSGTYTALPAAPTPNAAPPAAAAAPSASTPTAAPAVLAAAAPAEAKPAITGRFGGINVTLGGAVRTTVITSSARGQPDGTPFFLLPDFPGQPEGSTKFDARASNVTIGMDGLTSGDYKFGGLLLFTFTNGNLLSGGYGFTPLYAYVDAQSDDARFAMGLQEDVFSPRIPKMVDSISALAASGNPGNSSRAQLRAERYLRVGNRDKLTLIGALSDSLPQTVEPDFSRITENTGLPNLELRALYASGEPGPEAWIRWPDYEVGASGVAGRFRTLSPLGNFDSFRSTLWGIALDGRLRLGRQAGLQGELYTGQALGPYLATILQTVNLTTQQAIRSYGGWGEFAWYWKPTLHSHAGYGIDHNRSGDVAPGNMVRNQTAFANLIWDISPYTTVSVEGTWRRTDWLGLPDNEGVGLMLSTELRF